MATSHEQAGRRGAQQSTRAVHPLGSRAKILLASVFGPYAQDDEFGSRVLNPMELYHNQVTRVQGPFSVRMFHRSWGLMLIQVNLQAPCTLLDFPTLDRYIQELRDNPYDIIGISSIPLNVLKVRKMCQLVRQYQPAATVVVGGHIANMLDLNGQIDADFIVKGDGVAWFRRFLGEDAQQPIRHPEIISGIGTRSMGITVRSVRGGVAATVIPSVGCPLGCNFCSTSAMFGGKGRFVNFYPSGDELFDVMCQLERSMKVRSFFVMDENFLLHRRRSLRLLELLERYDKAWSLYVFSSANALRLYSIDQLVRLGVSWVWIGLEGEDSRYAKLHGIDTRPLVRELQANGIHVLGSSIIGLETHSPETIDEVIEFAVEHDSDFHQFMLYTPVEGTPLHAELLRQGRMKHSSEYHPGDIHGQSIFNYRHPHIKEGQEAEFIIRAFRRDFEVNGPSLIRLVRTTLAGWNRHKNHADRRVRRRLAWETREMATTYSALVWAAKRHYRDSALKRGKIAAIQSALYREFGWKSRVSALLGGPYVWWKMCREQRRLATGWTYEPPTFYEQNQAAAAIRRAPGAVLCRFVIPRNLAELPRCLVPGKARDIQGVR
jgi:radical SAM superfamily enzyme YgiQ (UPF0313 family)